MTAAARALAAARDAALCATPLQSLAVYTGQLQRSAWACASACETFETNVRVCPFGQALVTDPHGSRSAACRFASACETLDVNVVPQALASYSGGSGQRQRLAFARASLGETSEVNVFGSPQAQDLVNVQVGQLQPLAWARASASDSVDVNVCDRPLGQCLVNLQRHTTPAALLLASSWDTFDLWVTPLQSSASYTGGSGQLQRLAFARASPGETSEVNVFGSPQAQDLVNVQVGQDAAAALLSASSCETLDVNRRRPLGQYL